MLIRLTAYKRLIDAEDESVIDTHTNIIINNLHLMKTFENKLAASNFAFISHEFENFEARSRGISLDVTLINYEFDILNTVGLRMELPLIPYYFYTFFFFTRINSLNICKTSRLIV